MLESVPPPPADLWTVGKFKSAAIFYLLSAELISQLSRLHAELQ